MQSFVLCIAESLLTNPDPDLPYNLPEVIARESRGTIRDEGYEYTPDNEALLLFFSTERIDAAIACVTRVIEQIEVLENDLRKAAVLAVEKAGSYSVVYPPNFKGEFTL